MAAVAAVAQENGMSPKQTPRLPQHVLFEIRMYYFFSSSSLLSYLLLLFVLIQSFFVRLWER